MIRQRKPIPRLSEKRSKSGKPFLKRSAIKRKHRKPSETLRIYGGKKRIEFVRSLPCVACGYHGPQIENAHIETGGTGRKADSRFVVPLCGPRLPYAGCHRWLHTMGRIDFEDHFHISLSTEASRVQKLWELQQQED